MSFSSSSFTILLQDVHFRFECHCCRQPVTRSLHNFFSSNHVSRKFRLLSPDCNDTWARFFRCAAELHIHWKCKFHTIYPNDIFGVDKIFFKIIFRKISFPCQIPDQNNTNLTKFLPNLTYHNSSVWYVLNWYGKNNNCRPTHCNSVFHFSVHNQGQISKTISKNKSMHSLINNCCETRFHLLRMVLRSFIRQHYWIVFIFYWT